MQDQIEQLKLSILPYFEEAAQPFNERGKKNSFYYKRSCYEWEKRCKEDINSQQDFDAADKELLIDFVKKQTLLILSTTKLFVVVNRYKDPHPTLSVKISIAKGDLEQRLNDFSYFANQLKRIKLQKEESLALDLQEFMLVFYDESLGLLKHDCRINVLESPLAKEFIGVRTKIEKAVNEKDIEFRLRLRQEEKEKSENNSKSSIATPRYKDYQKKPWFKVGLAIAMGEIKPSALNNYSAPEIAKSLDLPKSAEKYILGTLNDYQTKESKDKNVYAYRMKMDLIIDYCKENDIEIDPDFMNRLPSEEI